ncbi:SPW repeat protein [Streptomyces avermitilis]
MAGAACALGVWTIVAPWAVADDVSTTTTIVNNIIAGVIAVLLALAASATARPNRSSSLNAACRRPTEPTEADPDLRERQALRGLSPLAAQGRMSTANPSWT